MIIIENLGKILIISITIITSILIVLIILEKKLNKKITKMNRNAFYISEIKKIEKSSPKKILKSTDKIARSFFEEAFKIKKFTGYSELKKSFAKKNNVRAVEFCEVITRLLYSKERNNDQIQRLISLLIEIVKTNKIVSREEEQIRTKKNRFKNYLRKVKIFGIGKKKLKNKKNNREEE